MTADQSHSYGPEQLAFNHFAMDLFPKETGSAGGTPVLYPPVTNTKGMVMGYFDGNTVTAMWNYAQRFALSDNSYSTQFGPSTPGALNLISGQTNGINASINGPSSAEVADGAGGFTLLGDADPLTDVCSNSTSFQMSLAGKNMGDLLLMPDYPGVGFKEDSILQRSIRMAPPFAKGAPCLPSPD